MYQLCDYCPLLLPNIIVMPPKATEKKPVAKKAAAFVQKEIDPTKYLRKVNCVHEVSDHIATLLPLLPIHIKLLIQSKRS